MHVPDGFLDAPTSVGTAVVAAGGVALALRGARRELDDRTAPLAGLVALFIFCTQMLNFPVAAGTSGHLLGGALAAVLVGPCTATLSITVVLLVQATLMADGGITALGTNITLMGLVGVWVGWLVFVALRRVLPQAPASGWCPLRRSRPWSRCPTAALAFALLFEVGGTVDVPFAHRRHRDGRACTPSSASARRSSPRWPCEHRRRPPRPRPRRPAQPRARGP